MGRIYETQNSAHAAAVAQALLEAGGQDNIGQITTTTGQNGRVAFAVPDDFADVNAPEPDDSDDADTSGGALHPNTSGVIGDTSQTGLEPPSGDEETHHQAKRRTRKTSSSGGGGGDDTTTGNEPSQP